MNDIKLPNGAIIKGVPDGATKEQIKAKAIALGLASESDFQISSAPQVSRYSNQQDAVEKLASEQGPLDATFISMGRGIENISRGIGKAAQSGFLGPLAYGAFKLGEPIEDRDKNSASERAYAALQEQRPYTTMTGEIIGETLPALPLSVAGAPASIGARVLATAGAGAAETGLSASGRDESAVDTAKAAGVGGLTAGAFEAAIPLFGRLIGQTFRRLTGETVEAVVDANGNVIPQVQRVLEANGVNVDELKSQAVKLTMDQPESLDEATRMARFRQQGVPYLPGDITQDFSQRAKEARLSEIQEDFADPIRDIRINQSRRIDDLRTEMAENLGRFSNEQTGDLTKEGIEIAEKLAKGEVKAKYNTLAEAAGFSGGMPLPIDPVQDVFADQNIAGMISRLSPDELNKIQSSLVEYGIETDQALIDSFIGSQRQGLLGKEAQIRPLTTENSEKFVQALNSVITPNSSNELRGLVGRIKGAVDSSYDMLDSQIGPELVSLAKDARLSNVAYKQEFSPRSLAGRLIRLQNDRVTPLVESSKAYGSLFGKATPIEQQRKTLDLLRRSEKGKKAIKSLQSNMIMDVFDAGFIPSSRMNGQQMFSGNSAMRYMNNLGDESVKELFKDSPELYDDFMSLLETGKDITPSGKEVVKGSGSVILNMTNQLADLTMANKLPAVGALLTTITRAVRGGADEQAIQKIINRSPKLKKQVEFMRENLPQLTTAMGLSAGTVAAKDDDGDQ